MRRSGVHPFRSAGRLVLLVLLPFLLLAPHQAPAQRVPRVQVDFYHPELEWKTIETEHFFVHYHDGAERTARVTAKIAEEIYEPVTSLYGHVPTQKVSFIIRDHDDISNGAAYFYDNKVEIYAPSMDFEFRGTHNWLRNVITHEFTHIVQMQTAMKFGRTIPAFYFQWLGYESERRPDVLYGFPNKIVSFPISGFVVPVWFAEGVAQYNRKELRYDFWDAHRDMILRAYVLDDTMLTWEQMSVFGKTSLGNESSYNAGFAFVHYLAQRYGEEKINEISRDLARFTEVTIDGAIERAVGRKGSLVYEDWKAEMRRSYGERVAPIRHDLREGSALLYYEEGDVPTSPGAPQEKMSLHEGHGGPAVAGMQPCCRAIAETGFANLHPKFSPDGKFLAFVSTGRGDYFSNSTLYIEDERTHTAKPLQAGVSTSPAWSPDGTRLYYGRSTRNNPHFSFQTDLYVYDVQKEEETRITYGRRALSPAVSPDGKRIACVVSSDGNTNLAVMNLDGSDYAVITPYANGEQVYNPVWSPSGERILFDYSVKDGRDIAWIKPDGSDLGFLVTGPDDSRGGTFMPDGSRILFSSDRTGVFNLYSYDPGTGKIAQISNVLGGAFMPTVNAEGRVVYAAYTSGGYKLYAMTNPVEMTEGGLQYVALPGSAAIEKSGPLALASEGRITTTQFDWQSLRSYDDTRLPPLEAKPYRSKFTSLSVVPFLRVDNYNTKNKAIEVVKPGVYLFSNEILEKLSFFAGGALNTKFERDLFVQFSYRGRIPGMYQLGLEPVVSLEAYNVTRKTDAFLELVETEFVPIDLTYILTEYDIAFNQPIVPAVAEMEFRYIHSRYTSVIESFFNPYNNRLYQASSDLYLISNTLSLSFRMDAVQRSRTDEINPVGRELRLTVSRELNKFNGDGQYTESPSGLVPVYKNVNFTRAELVWKEHLPLFFNNHTLTASFRGGSILGPEVDEFFDLYAGGLIGMKGYPFYSLGGNEMAVFGLNYRFPLAHNLDIRILPIYFDKLYASFYADIGDAWTGNIPTLKQFKTDAGMELRLESFSFYAYPTRIFLNVAYGFDQFTRLVRSRNESVTYGKEWSIYFGMLFGFDFD